MSTFIFHAHDIRGASGSMLVRGRLLSGFIKPRQSVRLLGKNGGDNIASVISFNKSQNGFDVLVLDAFYNDNPYYCNGLWVVGINSGEFTFIVNDIFEIAGRGTVVTGEVSSGNVKVGDTLSLLTHNGRNTPVVVSGIEFFRQLVDEAKKGDNVGIFLRGIKKTDINISDMLCTPQTVITPIYVDNVQNVTNSASLGKKKALLIGNCDYKPTKLKNCINDANALGEKLKAMGFDIKIIRNATKREIDEGLNDFCRMSHNAEVGYVFYSGHGLQYNGENYLVPIDADLNSPSDIDYKCNKASYILSKLEDANCNLKVLVLDACRVNPFTRSWYKCDSYKGLGVMNGPKGTIIAYATSPNEVAYDRTDSIASNSPYTIGLLKMLEIKDIDIVSYFNKVSSYVYEITKMQQNPWFACSALTGEFRFSQKSFAETDCNKQSETNRVNMASKYDMYLIDCGPAKLLVCKVLMGKLGLTIPEAKRLVDNTPVLIASKIDRYSTEILKDSLEEYQDVIEIRESI